MRSAPECRWAGRLVAGGAAAALSATPSVAMTQAGAEAVPRRGNSGWSVLLCTFNDVAAEPQTPAYFSRMFGSAGAGQEGLYDYFLDQS